MNKWKIAFFSLIACIMIALFAIFKFATASVATPTPAQSPIPEGNVVAIQTTAEEFEAIAKQYLADALVNSPVEVELSIEDQIYLNGDFSVFGVVVPLQMDFEPILHNGNIRLKQTAVHVGKLNIPPEMVLKLMRDGVDFPDWITVRPKEEEIYVDLSLINIAQNSKVRAKEIDLENNNIVLEVIIPNN